MSMKNKCAKKASNKISEGHELDWENASFIDSEKFWKGRKVKESLYISAQNPSKVVDAKVILNLEKGLESDPMWGFFNKQFRRTMEEKILMGAKLLVSFFFWSFQFF